jgi:hypothetical protein
MDAEPKVVKIIAEAERGDPAGGPFRVHRMANWCLAQWLRESSGNRVRDLVAWERDTIQPKYGLPHGIQYTLTSGTAELDDFKRFLQGSYQTVDGEVAKALGVRLGDDVFYHPRRGFDLWNARYFVVPAVPNDWKDESRSFAAFLSQIERVYPSPDAFVDPRNRDRREEWLFGEDLQVFRNKAVYPRAWVVHQARPYSPSSGTDGSVRRGPLDEILFTNDGFWKDPNRRVYDPRALAWVETKTMRDLAGYLPGTRPQANESVTVTSYTPQRVEIDAVLEQPGVIVLSDVDYPGWRLTIDGDPAPVFRVNLLMRGAAVKAGRHRLVYTYEPRSFYMGRWVSAGSLVALAALAAFFHRRPLSPGLAG